MNHAIRVGLFMFVVLIITGVFIIKIEDIPITQKGLRHVTVVFPDVAGLDAKSAVRVAGVRVGKVDSIRLLGDHAEVDLIVSRSLQLGRGARAAVRNMGLLGDKYVELIPGDTSAGLLPPDQKIKGISPVSYDRILELVSSIGEDVKSLTTSFRHTLGGEEGQNKLDRIVTNIQDFTGQLRAMVAENRSAVRETTGNIEMTTADLKERLPEILAGVRDLVDQLNTLLAENRSNVSGTLEEAKKASVKLNASLTSLSEILDDLNHGKGTVGKLLKNDDTHDHLLAAMDSVKNGADTLTNSIGRVTKWNLDLNFRSEYQTDISESKSFFGLKLTPRENRFYQLEFVDDPVGKRKMKDQTTTTVGDDGTPVTVTEHQVKYDDTFTVTAMFGWKIHDFQLRGGIIESSGGVAVDYLPFNGKLNLSVEAFDFSREDDKDFHLKLSSRYYVTSHLYVVGGWDDPLSNDRDTFFVGGGFTWRDDDFKYLLGSGVKP